MKKSISIVLVLSIIASIFAMCGVSASSAWYGDFQYSIVNDEVTITGTYHSIGGELVIPETIDGYPVTTIAPEAFIHAQKVTSFSIPSTVKTIGEDAFVDCIRLERFIVDENNDYFMSDEYGVLFNKNQTELIMYPDASANTVYSIPETVVSVAHCAFRYCINLEYISIPASVETLGDLSDIIYNPFESCMNLKVIELDEDNQHFVTDESGVLFNKDKTILIKYPVKSELKEYAVPSGVKVILLDAFGYASNLESVFVPETVETVGGAAFRYMSNLKTVDYRAKAENLYDNMFIGCYSLENIELAPGIKTIGYTVFTYGSSLKSIVIPEGVESMTGSFIGCYGLESITLPDSLSSMQYAVVGDCFYLKNINVPASLKKIESTFLYNCYSIENIVFPVTVEEMEEDSIRNCHALKDIYIYNPDVVINERAIGYVDEQISDIEEYKRLIKESSDLVVKAYCNNEEESPAADELYVQAEKLRIDLDESVPCENTVIHGYKGSTAQVYAETYGFKFEPICEHFNKETINAVDSDCENDGYTGDVYCYDCEKIIEEGKIIPSTGHNYVENIITDATYTQDGLKNTVCENCGDATAEVKIPMLEIEDSEEEKDEDTGVSVIFPDGTFDEDAEIEITPVEEGEAYKLISHKQGNYKVTMFDINVTVDGQKVQPNGTVLVKIPLPKGYNQNKCVVYYVADDGTMEELKTYHLKDGYVYFETDHFSYYAVIEDVEENENVPDEELSFIEKVIAFINMIIDFFKKIFGIL